MIRLSSGYHSRRKFALVTAILLITSISNPQGFLNNSYATPLFGTSVPLSADFGSSNPQIASDGTDVYVVWQNVNGNISYIPTSSGGQSTSIVVTSRIYFTMPQIAASGTD